jgi:ribosomal protein S19E (S16A)
MCVTTQRVSKTGLMQGYQSRVNTSIRPYEGGSVSEAIVHDLVELLRKTGLVVRGPDSAAERTLFVELKSESQVCSREQQRM